jgi:peptide/nickel transport system ATP-binding protein
VEDVSFDIFPGETLGLVGESGCGKTTVGRLILRLEQPTSGTIEFAGKNLLTASPDEMRTIRRKIQVIFQDPYSSLNPRMTVGQIIGEPLYVNGTHSGAKLRERVAELLNLVGLPASAMERYPHAFSGGQRQRISIARAIAPDPRIIIADEATSALDVSLRIQILDLLLDLQERLDLSFIFISHDIAVIRYFCDRIAVMHRGKIVETGETETVCNSPRHPYTRSLLSAVPVADPRRRGMTERIRYQEAS